MNIETMIGKSLEFLVANGKRDIADYIAEPIFANPGETIPEKLAAATAAQIHKVRAKMGVYFTWVKVPWCPVAVPIFSEDGRLVVTEESLLAEKQAAIRRAVKVIEWDMMFGKQKGSDGSEQNYAEFYGRTGPIGRQLVYCEFYEKIEDLADKLNERWKGYDGAEEARFLLQGAGNSLDFDSVVADVKDEEAQLKDLANAVRLGLENKLPKRKEPGLYAAANFYEKLEAAKENPGSAITPEALKELDKLCEETFGLHMYDIVRNWAVQRKI